MAFRQLASTAFIYFEIAQHFVFVQGPLTKNSPRQQEHYTRSLETVGAVVLLGGNRSLRAPAHPLINMLHLIRREQSVSWREATAFGPLAGEGEGREKKITLYDKTPGVR